VPDRNALVLLLARAGFGRVQWLFVAVGVEVSAAHAISSVLARPDWGRAAASLVVPHGNILRAQARPVRLLGSLARTGQSG
jgi:hypothetical protein